MILCVNSFGIFEQLAWMWATLDYKNLGNIAIYVGQKADDAGEFPDGFSLNVFAEEHIMHLGCVFACQIFNFLCARETSEKSRLSGIKGLWYNKVSMESIYIQEACFTALSFRKKKETTVMKCKHSTICRELFQKYSVSCFWAWPFGLGFALHCRMSLDGHYLRVKNSKYDTCIRAYLWRKNGICTAYTANLGFYMKRRFHVSYFCVIQSRWIRIILNTMFPEVIPHVCKLCS